MGQRLPSTLGGETGDLEVCQDGAIGVFKGQDTWGDTLKAWQIEEAREHLQSMSRKEVKKDISFSPLGSAVSPYSGSSATVL